MAGSASSRGCGRSCFPPFRYFGCLGSAEVGIEAGFVFVVKTMVVVVVDATSGGGSAVVAVALVTPVARHSTGGAWRWALSCGA